MKGPSDQAKLLFLGLLRTVSALATEPKIGASALGYNSASGIATGTGPITLRLARRTDVPSIQRCNLATLPENYNQQFYINHMRAWPELTLVAETYHNPEYPSPFHPQPEPNIVAYVLGKVEERQIDVGFDENMMMDQYGRFPPSTPQRQFATKRIGHVTSLAVLPEARRQGIAQDLMEQLHFHLHSLYRVDSVGLHVRQSNFAAGKLYRQQGYAAVEQIPDYYQDGEDAYFMQKTLSEFQQQQQHYPQEPPQRQYQHDNLPWHQQPPSQQGRFFGLRRQPQQPQHGPSHLQLPRPIGRDLAAPTSEILTGAM